MMESVIRVQLTILKFPRILNVLVGERVPMTAATHTSSITTIINNPFQGCQSYVLNLDGGFNKAHSNNNQPTILGHLKYLASERSHHPTTINSQSTGAINVHLY